MNRNILKKYAPQARRDFIQAVTDRASYYGLTKKKTEPVTVEGDVAVITGRAFPKKVGEQRKQLEQRVARQGFDQVMEAMAYTWFNRLVAIRFMELHEYLEHGYRVLSHPAGSNTPEILEHADSVDLPGLDSQQVIDLKLAGDKDAELYRMLLIAQCNALHKAMPFLFERIDDETELLLPDNLLHSDSLIRTLVSEIPEEDWQEVEIIGWLYQFYISEKKDQVIGKVVKSEDIPAATQLFTPNWIVKYLVQNSLGRQWVATYPNSPLKNEMEYYVEPAEQTPEVQEQLKAITPDKLAPEGLTLLDPACGSGHILVEAYDLLKAIYLERGFSKKDIPRLILEKNLYGLEIDDRAAQLASLALMMKARADDRRIFAQGIQPHVLAIQESKGLDAKEITEALNAPILMTELPPSGELFEEIAEEKSPLFSKKNLSVKGDVAQANIACLIDLFEHGKTFGSLIQVPENLAKKLPAIAKRVDDVMAHGGMFEQAAAKSLRSFIEQAQVLASNFDAVVANPPYMGTKGFESALASFIKGTFPRSRSDLSAVFVERCVTMTHPRGHVGLVTMHSWMFLSSLKAMRQSLLNEATIMTMAHLGPRAFDSISGEVVSTTAFVCMAHNLSDHRGRYIRLTEGRSESEKESMLRCAAQGQISTFAISIQQILQIPGSPIAYWVSAPVLRLFAEERSVGDVVKPRQGMSTNDNARFLRYWFEVSFNSIGLNCTSSSEAAESGKKWFPYNKGGKLRKWYGNYEYVVNWQNDGQEIKEWLVNNPKDPNTSHWSRRIINTDFYFKEGITWADITTDSFAARYATSGSLFDVKGSSAFPSADNLYSLLGFMNSKLMTVFMKILNPTVTFQVGDIARVPYVDACESPNAVTNRVHRLVEIAKSDWDSAELSWDFQRHPLIDSECSTALLRESYCRFSDECGRVTLELKRLEEENNSTFVNSYGLADELSPDVDLGDIALRANKVHRYGANDTEQVVNESYCRDTVRDLLSFAIGCMMGRYSLDEPGLIYAHCGNERFDPSKYATFPADEDGIIPITEFDWFEDDAANRVEQFISTAWPEDHLEENLRFASESIGQKKGESTRDGIRRYLCTSFYKYHLSLYKRRPIYWLFSSGKQRAFQCLVYLHRYNAGTLARMRTEYVIPLSGKIDARIEQLAGDIAAASSTSHAKKLTKERDTLIKHSEELQKFDEKLKHYADQRIELDLDDGVKVNYGKFGDLLAEVKAVTGQKAE